MPAAARGGGDRADDAPGQEQCGRAAAGQGQQGGDDGELLHHVHSDDPRFPFDIGEQPAGVPKSVRFTARGVFEVRCGIHPRMLLQVTVR
jgi:hypothetical protein